MDVRIPVPGAGEVSGTLVYPGQATHLLVLGHGAGADMRHRSMEATAAALEASGIATLRYQFPFMERGSGPPDLRAVLLATVRSAVNAAADLTRLPLLAGGRSMGGRMTSLAAASEPLPGVRGIVFFAFPLHPSSKPSTERAEHLDSVPLPMLFLQGTRDALAEEELVRQVCGRLGERARLHIIATADHSFHVLKSSGKTDGQVMTEMGNAVAEWAAGL